MSLPTKQELETAIIKVIKDILRYDGEVTPASHLVDDLDFDSLDLMEVLVEVQELYNFDMPEGKVEGLGTISNTAEFLLTLIAKKSS
jgi:acyl carrier protein